jgi:hypothetical protein
MHYMCLGGLPSPDYTPVHSRLGSPNPPQVPHRGHHHLHQASGVAVSRGVLRAEPGGSPPETARVVGSSVPGIPHRSYMYDFDVTPGAELAFLSAWFAARRLGSGGGSPPPKLEHDVRTSAEFFWKRREPRPAIRNRFVRVSESSASSYWISLNRLSNRILLNI